MADLTERYAKQIAGMLRCLDRVVIWGTLTDVAYSKAMETYLRSRNIRLFDDPRWAEPLKEVIRKNAEQGRRERVTQGVDYKDIQGESHGTHTDRYGFNNSRVVRP